MPNKIEAQIGYLGEYGDIKNLILFGDYEVIDENSKFVRTHKAGLAEPDYLFIRFADRLAGSRMHHADTEVLL